MLRYLHAADLTRFPLLAHSMFTDRAAQFSDRLNWDVTVNAVGEERDEYDALSPFYIIWELPDGRHGGSMRMMPTTDRCMVNEHFLYLNDGHPIQSPFIWECTRFCLSQSADARVAAALSLGAGEWMEHMHIEHYVAVFDRSMERIYRRMGLEPVVLGRSDDGGEQIGVGLWAMNAAAFAPTLARVGVSREISRGWLRYSLARGSVSIPLAEAV